MKSSSLQQIFFIVAILTMSGGYAYGQLYEMTIQGPDRVEGEPGTSVTVEVNYYITAATHDFYGFEWEQYINGSDYGFASSYGWNLSPSDVPFWMGSSSFIFTVPSDGSSLTLVFELRNALIQGPEGFVTPSVNGKTIIVGPITNEPPVVDAGPDQIINCDGPSCSVYLDGTAYDPDGYPGPLRINWTYAGGPGIVTFDDDSSASTNAHFSAAGVYLLVLTADDGNIIVSDQVQITVLSAGSATSCNPIGYWNLDEESGLTAHDVSGNGHDGTLQGSPRWVSGYYGNALEFDGIDDYIDLGNPPSFPSGKSERSMCGWARTDTTGPGWRWIAAYGSPVTSQAMFIGVNGDDLFGGGYGNDIRMDDFWQIGVWHHICLTYDGTTAKLYADGVNIVSEAKDWNLVLRKGRIGQQVNDWGEFWDGLIDDVRIYDCVLSAEQIQAIMTDPSGGQAGTMFIREVIDNGPITNQDECYKSLESNLGTGVEYDTAVLNIFDNGSYGHFDNDEPFGVVSKGHRTLGSVEDLSLEANGVVRIPSDKAGVWTFGVNSDDGFTLQFPGYDFTSVVNGEIIPLDDGDAIRFFGGRAASDTFGTINLPPGDHYFWLTYHESRGNASLEFFAAEGTHEVFDPEVFHLVGRTDIGNVAVPGLCDNVTMEASRPGAWSGGLVDSLADARAALSQGRSSGTNTSSSYMFVNHIDPDLGGPFMGIFPDDVSFPNNVPGTDDNDFAVKVTGLLDIPADGTYQIGFNSDDGASLRIPGQLWSSIVEDAANNAVISGDELKSDSLTAWSFTIGEITLTAGCHSFEAVMFERGGGAFFELIGRGVSDKGLADPGWHLLRVGGAQTPSPAQGLQLVPLMP